MATFKQFKFSDELHKAIDRMDLQNPTEIQEKTIPPIIEGKDIIGESETGSGKTLAFGCGIVERVTPRGGLQALVITPTRELAEQVKDYLCQLAYNKHLKIISIYGGVSINNQFELLKKAEVVVATPGRFKDHLQRRTVDTSKISILVLDEVDRMLDMGFIDDIRMIISSCPKKRQTMFFSATIPLMIRKLSDIYLNKPVKISARKYVDPEKLKQVYYDVPGNMKLSLLVHLLRHERSGLVMVFCNTRRNTDYVEKILKTNGIDAIAIHGGLTQDKRTRTIQLFNEARVQVLVCTDVAARGLHVENVSHIYNYELPGDSNDYIHRIGRTARAGKEGKVINLLSQTDHDNFSRILRDYRSFSIKKLDKPYIEKIVVSSMGRMYNPRGDFRHRRRY